MEQRREAISSRTVPSLKDGAETEGTPFSRTAWVFFFPGFAFFCPAVFWAHWAAANQLGVGPAVHPPGAELLQRGWTGVMCSCSACWLSLRGVIFCAYVCV